MPARPYPPDLAAVGRPTEPLTESETLAFLASPASGTWQYILTDDANEIQYAAERQNDNARGCQHAEWYHSPRGKGLKIQPALESFE